MNLKKIAVLALFIALSVVFAMIKIPSFVGSVALDAFPALLAGVLIGRGSGAIVGALGHVLSALMAGFPLGPLHAIVAVEMAVIVWCFAMIYTSGKHIWACLFFIISNSVIAALPFLILFGTAFYMALLPSLFAGALLNGALAFLCIPRLLTLLEKQLGFLH